MTRVLNRQDDPPVSARRPTSLVPYQACAGIRDLSRYVRVGDVVFIRIPLLPFRKVADTTLTWTNHVGVVTDVSGAEPVIAESRVPFSGTTSLSRFVRRSELGGSRSQG